MKALYVLACVALLYSCVGCGSTIRLDYDGGKSGKVGIGITLPDDPAKESDAYEAEVKRNFPNAQAKKVADSYEITLSRDSIAYVTGPTEKQAWRMAAKKLR